MSVDKNISLGTRMKSYERDEKVPANEPFIMRLDGKNFSSFTKGFQKPFDKRMTDAMIATMNNLINFTHCVTGFCCSDEITLVFPANDINKNHLYDGRKTKLNTIVSSKCSVCFNKNIRKQFTDLAENEKMNYTSEFLQKIEESECVFDSRIITFPDGMDYEIVNNILWRSVYDCHRNAVSTYARHIIGHKNTMNKTGEEMIKIMKNTGVDWEDVPYYFKYGVYGKKVLVDNVEDGVVFTRSKIKNKLMKIKFTDKVFEMIMSKYWIPVDIETFDL